MGRVRAVFNGVDRSTGGYLFAPQPLEEVAASLAGLSPQAALQQSLELRHAADEDDLGVMFGFDPESLASVGWGVVVGPGVDPAVLEALEPLLTLRARTAGERFQRLDYLPGEGSSAWLDRHEMAPSVADPRKIPYYLLLVGGPGSIPYEFQYELGIDYAVGRVHFDTAADYACYAATVCAAEEVDAPARAHLFGTRNPADEATALSSELLVGPLRDEIVELSPGTVLGHDIGPAATRARLAELLVGDAAPSVLFTASHGLGDSGAADPETQGALVCQDWPGPLLAGGLEDGHYFAGRDVASDRAVRAQVVLTFACYGAGTPAVSDFGGAPLAAEPFVARLPQRLLANPAGGALAFVGHVDRAFGYSFLWTGVDARVTAMAGTLLALLGGMRLGSAMEAITSRYATVGANLANRLGDQARFARSIDAETLVGLWTAYYDARNYVILGDPAVRAVRAGDGRSG